MDVDGTCYQSPDSHAYCVFCFATDVLEEKILKGEIFYL